MVPSPTAELTPLRTSEESHTQAENMQNSQGDSVKGKQPSAPAAPLSEDNHLVFLQIVCACASLCTRVHACLCARVCMGISASACSQVHACLVWTCVHVYVCLRTRTRVHACMCACMHVYTCTVCMHMYTYICVWMHMCACVYCVHGSACTCVAGHACLRMHMCGCTRVCMCVHVCMRVYCAHIHVCACVSMCTCVCVYSVRCHRTSDRARVAVGLAPTECRDGSLPVWASTEALSPTWARLRRGQRGKWGLGTDVCTPRSGSIVPDPQRWKRPRARRG